MRRWSQICTGWLLTAIVVTLGPGSAAAADPQKVAVQVDTLLAKEHFGGTAQGASKPAPRADDEKLFRRLSLDLIGELPSSTDLATFLLKTEKSKRTAAVDRLLASEKFGVNWGRYWRDVVFYRRSDDKTLIGAPALEAYLAQQFNENVPWDRITHDFVTATGDVLKEGRNAIIVAQLANPVDTASEISRIFLGIQIQCAQCHNHPTDRWQREQFHQLAAFFPRIGMEGGKGTFVVVSQTKGQKRQGQGGSKSRDMEHYMPDLSDPKAKGTLMRPVFFATGKKLDEGLSDEERREKLAEWLTAREDGWFAKAFVNRIWAELVGRGFYEPVDDLGPDRKCSAPKTLDYLAKQFVASKYDVKWLFRTIVATAAYQRESRSRPETAGAPMSATCPQRLRADQLFNSLASALEIEEEPQPNGPKQNKKPGKNAAGRRSQMNRTFGYDPSLRREDVSGSIPQALSMMNSTDLNRAISAKQPNTMLGKLLAEVKDDDKVVGELYRRCLARAPKPTELETCLAYVKESKDRNEAFEDILWSLVNSSDFLYRE